MSSSALDRGCLGRPGAARHEHELHGRVDAEREGLDRDEADRRVRSQDRARKEFVRRVFGVDPNDRALYHLIIDTVALGVDASVELVVSASRARTRPPPEES